MQKKTSLRILAIVILLALVLGGLYWYKNGGFGPKTPEGTIPTPVVLDNTGKQVYVNYVWTLEDGTVFDTNIESVAQEAGLTRDAYVPLTFVVGNGDTIKWFENAVKTMKVGETKTVTLQPDEAYGPYNPALVEELPRDTFQQADIVPEVGDSYVDAKGIFSVTEVTDSTVKIDRNNMMAGKVLTFNITMLQIDTPQEQPINVTQPELQVEEPAEQTGSSQADLETPTDTSVEGTVETQLE